MENRLKFQPKKCQISAKSRLSSIFLTSYAVESIGTQKHKFIKV